MGIKQTQHEVLYQAILSFLEAAQTPDGNNGVFVQVIELKYNIVKPC